MIRFGDSGNAINCEQTFLRNVVIQEHEAHCDRLCLFGSCGYGNSIVTNFVIQNEEIGEEFVQEEVGPEFEEINTEDWQLVPDTDGNMHLVDINAVDLEMEPQFVASDIVFRLFTRTNPTAAQVVTFNNNAQLNTSNYNPALQTRFHIHGWNGGGAATGAGIRNAFITAINCNVFTVDWGELKFQIIYSHVIVLVQLDNAEFIDWLNLARGQAFSAVGIVGHSLGAHCPGAAGKRTAHGRLQLISGLDPAGPLFSVADSANRLHHTDAIHTESIVTDGGNLGFLQPIAHSNFYPNWGVNQPGCAGSTCSHTRLNDFFQHSCNHANVFGATRCNGIAAINNRNCVSAGASLGGHTGTDGTSPALTVFSLTTGATAPFAHGPR